MSTFFGASVGRKLIVALSGLFLIVFLVVHLSVNLTMYFGSETYNAVANWMGTHPAIVAMRPVLILGLLVHLVLSADLAISNWRTRPQGYLMTDPAGGSTWASRNMFVLGVLILLFLVLHISSFSFRLTFGTPPMTEVSGVVMKDAFALVTARFGLWWYVGLYVLAMIFLGLHLAHGFQSVFQTFGLSNHRWRRVWTVIGNAYAAVIAIGFASLPIYFFIQAQMSSAS